MSISFSSIPIDTLTPGHYLEVDPSRAMQGLAIERKRILLLGQGASGSGLNTLLRMDSIDQIERLTGADRLMSSMYRSVKAVNPSAEVWCILFDVAGTKASGTITYSGTGAIANKTQTWHIGGRAVTISAVAGDMPATAATKLAAAINADKRMLVKAVAAGAVVTLTCTDNGEWGNNITAGQGYNALSDSGLIFGLPATVVQPSGGTGVPNLALFESIVGDEWFQTVVCPYTDAASIAAMSAAMADRFGPMRQLDGHVYMALSGGMTPAATISREINSPHITMMYSGKSPSMPWEWAAQAAALDSGESDPARPRHTLAMTVLPASEAYRPTQVERNLLLKDGLSTTKVDAGGRVRIERLITTYRLNEWDAVDTSYMDVETMRTLSYLRFTVRNRIGTKYPRHKLANDGTLYGPGQAIVTPSVIRSELLGLFREWEYAGLVEGFDQFKRDLVVERNTQDPNRVDAVIPPDVVNQFRVFAGLVQFRL